MTFRVSNMKEFEALRARLGQRSRPTASKPAAATTATGLADSGWDLADEIGTARHWQLLLPPVQLINANEVRHWHWSDERKAAAAIRQASATLARTGRVPRLERGRFLYVIHPRERTQRFDPLNWALSAKAAGDGLVDAGVFADDDSRTVIGADARAGNLVDPANIRMTLVIVERPVKLSRQEL